MKELLPPSLYSNARIVLDQKNLAKTIAKISTTQKKQEEKEIRKSRKRKFKERLLVWDEEIIKHTDDGKDYINCLYTIKRKNQEKVKDKLEFDRYCSEHDDSKSITSKFSEHNYKDIINNSIWDNFGNHQSFKLGILMRDSHKSLLFDSIDNKSSYEIICSDNKLHDDNISPIKNFISPNKILADNIELDEINKTPFYEKIRETYNEGYIEGHFKALVIQKFKHTPLSKENFKSFLKNTPKKDLNNILQDHINISDQSFISPKKEISFGKRLMSSPHLSRTPVHKQVFGTPSHPIDLFEDENTKAEFSNLFSNKSNHFGNI